MSKKENEYHDTMKSIIWDIFQERALSQRIITDVIKFHQSSVFFRVKNMRSSFISPDVRVWLENVECTDVLPDIFEEEIPLSIEKVRINGSNRSYNLSYRMDEKTLGAIMYKAFGRDNETLSKRYGSAGALYPVMPLLLVLKPNVISSLPMPGVYMFNPLSNSIYRIRKWTEKDLEKLKECIFIDGEEFVSSLVMAYAIDIRRAVTKYGKRGYRHALIEVGLMAQGFRESLREVKENLRDLCWSGFNDNALTYLVGLNVRLAPVVLLQWFGERGD
ncbi:hypothetical protein [Anoxybacillus flavithermus]|uniref:hypothetical protein n=2 Tax=Anoxybacillus flavithermus TaxID=33934 RepID=UPI0018663CE7|nr:hypothetical protein [Anoxybacillus flavithermus]MBE2914311.1 hypothetical protein [Anoxybacillus flavithermus]